MIKAHLIGKIEFKHNRDRIIVYTQNLQDFNFFKEYLNKADIEYHTYTPKSELGPKMIVFLPTALTSEEVIEDLLAQGLHTDKVEQFFKKENNFPRKLPVFAVSFKKGTLMKDILDVRAIAHCRVQWQKYKNKKLVTRCFKCQCIGHLAMHCHKKPRCEHCAESHNAGVCPRLNVNPKCANCAGEHKSSDSNCPFIMAAEAKKLKLQHKHKSSQSFLLDSAQFPVISGTSAGARSDSPTQWPGRRIGVTQETDSGKESSIFSLLKYFTEAFDMKSIFVKLKSVLFKIKSAPDNLSKLAIIAETIFSLFD